MYFSVSASFHENRTWIFLLLISNKMKFTKCHGGKKDNSKASLLWMVDLTILWIFEVNC